MITTDEKEEIRQAALQLGAARCGFAQACAVEEWDNDLYDSWIDCGMNANMEYCVKYGDVRRDPRLLLGGAKTVISCAFSYNIGAKTGIISSYALCDDYHYVIKEKLNKLAEHITARHGGECRAVVDTAPMRERYWAVKAGIGFTGLNGQLIVEGVGSYVFIGHLLWTEDVAPDKAHEGHCKGCKRCIIACPGGALNGKGGCDGRKCVSYLTIEHRGELDCNANLGGMIYGCDVCQKVCPHNQGVPETDIPEFLPKAEIASLSAEALLEMTPSHYKRLVAHSAMRRAPLKQLQRNIGFLLKIL